MRIVAGRHWTQKRDKKLKENENKWQGFGEIGDVGMESVCGSLLIFLIPLLFLLLEVSKLKLFTSPFLLCKREKPENN